MDDEQFIVGATAGNSALNSPSIKRWEARLNLVFKHAKGRAYLAKNHHFGPLVLQKSLHPEGEAVCHGVIIHPPGGVAGGDELTLDVQVEKGAHALLTSPGAGKWYKANGLFASQHLDFNVAESGCLEWLPQENILFDGSQTKFKANIHLAHNAKYAAWDILCFGRQAQSEQWQTGSLHQQLAIYREGKLIWNERSFIKPNQPAINAMVGLGGHAVSASFVIAAGVVPIEVITECQAVKADLAGDVDAKYGVTALPEVFSARYVGQSSQSAKRYFEQLWQILRPWYVGKEPTRPRIWNT